MLRCYWQTLISWMISWHLFSAISVACGQHLGPMESAPAAVHLHRALWTNWLFKLVKGDKPNTSKKPRFYPRTCVCSSTFAETYSWYKIGKTFCDGYILIYTIDISWYSWKPIATQVFLVPAAVPGGTPFMVWWLYMVMAIMATIKYWSLR